MSCFNKIKFFPDMLVFFLKRSLVRHNVDSLSWNFQMKKNYIWQRSVRHACVSKRLASKCSIKIFAWQRKCYLFTKEFLCLFSCRQPNRDTKEEEEKTEWNETKCERTGFHCHRQQQQLHCHRSYVGIVHKVHVRWKRNKKKTYERTLLTRHSLGAHWHKWESGKMRFKHGIYRKLYATKNLGWWRQSHKSKLRYLMMVYLGENGRTVFRLILSIPYQIRSNVNNNTRFITMVAHCHINYLHWLFLVTFFSFLFSLFRIWFRYPFRAKWETANITALDQKKTSTTHCNR